MDPSLDTPSEVVVKEHRSVSVWTANLVGIPFLAASLALFVGAHTWFWEVPILETVLRTVRRQDGVLALFFMGVVAHEGLHVLAMWGVGGVPWSQIEIGIKWKLLTPYVHTNHVMTAGAYRIVALTPGVLLGLLPVGIGLGTGSMIWTLYGALFTGVAGGDVVSVWRLRGVPATAWVQDASDGCGCEVVVPAPEQRGVAEVGDGAGKRST